MDIRKIMELTGARCVAGDPDAPVELTSGFAADLMSDVLFIDPDGLLFVTGMCDMQTIRTAEMSDLRYVLFIRGKRATPEMIELAVQHGITLLESSFSMFRAIGELAKAGMRPVF